MKVYLGIDVGSSNCYLHGFTEDDTVVVDQKVYTSESNLASVLEEVPGRVHVNIEASEMTHPIRKIVLPQVDDVIISHPRTNAWVGNDPQKCDRKDAMKLASQLRAGQAHEVYYTDDEEMRQLRRSVQYYQKATHHRTRVKNQIKSHYRQEGIFELSGKAVFDPDQRYGYLNQLPDGPIRAAANQLYAIYDCVDEQKALAKETMRHAGYKFEIVPRLLVAPGVGIVSACTLVGDIQDPHRFANKRKVIRYADLAVTNRKSNGKPLGYFRLDRSGRSSLKQATYRIFMGAQKTRDENRFSRYYHQRLQAGKPKKHARLDTQRYILTCLWTMWKNDEEYVD